MLSRPGARAPSPARAMRVIGSNAGALGQICICGTFRGNLKDGFAPDHVAVLVRQPNPPSALIRLTRTPLRRGAISWHQHRPRPADWAGGGAQRLPIYEYATRSLNGGPSTSPVGGAPTMLNTRRVSSGILMLALLTGCGPSVQLTKLSPTALAPRPEDYPIQIMREKRPSCAFDELAIVNATRPNTLVSMDAMVEALRKKAREVGGDAIIGLSNEARVTGASPSYVDNSVDVDRKTVLSGTVIRFKSATCMQ